MAKQKTKPASAPKEVLHDISNHVGWQKTQGIEGKDFFISSTCQIQVTENSQMSSTVALIWRNPESLATCLKQFEDLLGVHILIPSDENNDWRALATDAWVKERGTNG